MNLKGGAPQLEGMWEGLFFLKRVQIFPQKFFLNFGSSFDVATGCLSEEKKTHV